MSSDLHFREVIRPPLWLVAFISMLLASLVIAVWAAFTNAAASYTAIASIFLLAAFYRANTHRIEVDSKELRIDLAHIELTYLGEVALLPQEVFLIERTRNFNPAAYPAIIYWVPKGIKVEIKDERDPTPYWLISTKRGEELSALLANRL